MLLKQGMKNNKLRIQAICKLLFLVAGLVLVNSKAFAQSRFYAGIQAGPKLSFSNTTLFNDLSALEINRNAVGKLKHQLGAVIGYTFKNPRFSIETGFLIHDHAMVAQFGKRPDYPTPPKIEFEYGTNQIPLIIKTVLNDPKSKVRLKFNLGAAWILTSSLVAFEDKSIYDRRFKNEPYWFPYSENSPENFTFDTASMLYAAKENWLLLWAFEAEMNLTSRFNLGLSLNYQTSIRQVQAFGFEYNYNYQRSPNGNVGVFYEPMEYGSLQSKAEALNLNVGLTYAFGKRNKAVE